MFAILVFVSLLQAQPTRTRPAVRTHATAWKCSAPRPLATDASQTVRVCEVRP